MSAPPPKMSADGLDPSVADLLLQAIDRHRASDFPGAESLYRSILTRQPGHPDANHNLGVLLVTTGKAATALPYFQAAIQTNPTHGQFWLSCIDALIRLSQFDMARQMVTLSSQCGLPGNAVAALQRHLQNAGLDTPSAESDTQSIGPAQTEEGAGSRQFDQETPDAKMPAVKPVTKKHKQRGSTLHAPTVAECVRLQSLFEKGREEEMRTLARSLIARFPNSGFAWNILGANCQREHRFTDAEGFFRSALQAEPNHADACFNLGRMLQLKGGLAEAEHFYRRAIGIRPDFLEAHFSLGEVLFQEGSFAESEHAYRETIRIQPDLAVAHNSLAIVLRRQHRPGESELSGRRAITLNPNLAESHCTLGAALQDQGRLPEAVASYDRALAINPNLAVAHHGYLFCLSHGGETEPKAIFEAHLRFGEQAEASLRAAWPVHKNSRDPNRQLLVGFVSGDFRDHAMANFVEPMLTSLADRADLSLHAYSNYAGEDGVTHRLRARIPHWHRIFALSDATLAAKIQADGIDILVDLSGHTAHNRLLTFARKPAPIQCGWIGYLGTSGLQSIDYYLADRYFLPPGEFDRYFSERIVHLSAVAPFKPSPHAPDVRPLPALHNGHFTFGSFSRISKLNPQVIALWSRLLRAIPDAHMLIGAMPDHNRCQMVAEWFAAEGITASRIQFHTRCDLERYFALHHQVDLCLDPFPFTGATTTGNAMWMGVPTLTLEGQVAPGRLGPALLRHLELEDFVAQSPDDFVNKGISWARRREDLAELRTGMRARFLRSTIGQPALVAESLASAFRKMWTVWCAPPSEPSQEG